MVKKLTTIILIASLVGIVYFGKKWIDENASNLTETIGASLEAFNKSNDVRDLDTIMDLVENYSSKDEKLSEINTITFNKIASWSTYLNGKYVCDIKNKMACISQLAEFTTLKTKLETIYKQETSGGDKILTANSYNKLNSEITKKINNITQVSKNSATIYPRTANEEMKYQCSLTINCYDCSSSSATSCTCEKSDKTKVTCPKSMSYGKIVES